MLSIFRSLCFSSQLKKILSFYFNICLLSDSCLTWKFKLSHKTHHKLVFQPFFYDYSLRHSSSMIKTLVSLYNLTVSFFLQKTAAIIVVIYIFHMCVFFSSLSLLPLTFLADWNCFIIPLESVKSPSSYKLITRHWLFVWEEIKCRDFLGDGFV